MVALNKENREICRKVPLELREKHDLIWEEVSLIKKKD